MTYTSAYLMGVIMGILLGICLYRFARPYILSWKARQLEGLPDNVDKDIYEECEVIPNATVQVLQNSRTGEYSIGWWRNK